MNLIQTLEQALGRNYLNSDLSRDGFISLRAGCDPDTKAVREALTAMRKAGWEVLPSDKGVVIVPPKA